MARKILWLLAIGLLVVNLSLVGVMAQYFPLPGDDRCFTSRYYDGSGWCYRTQCVHSGTIETCIYPDPVEEMGSSTMYAL